MNDNPLNHSLLAKNSIPPPSEADREAIPDVMPSDPLSSSIGYQLPESPNEDEDSEGRSQSEQLAEKGVKKAELDQALQAAIENAKNDKGEP